MNQRPNFKPNFSDTAARLRDLAAEHRRKLNTANAEFDSARATSGIARAIEQYGYKVIRAETENAHAREIEKILDQHVEANIENGGAQTTELLAASLRAYQATQMERKVLRVDPYTSQGTPLQTGVQQSRFKAEKACQHYGIFSEVEDILNGELPAQITAA